MKKADDILRKITKGRIPIPQQQELILTTQQERIVQAATEIALDSGSAEDASFLHAILCQVGMPRKRTNELSFERKNGNASLLLTAGKWWNGRKWIQQPLPYGAKSRLILINLTTYALLHKTPVVDVGRSTREFMKRVGLADQGSEYRSLRTQTKALAVCRMQLAGRVGNRITQLDTQPIKGFDAWITPDPNQQALWPGTVELTHDYYESVLDAAVPLDERAVAALRGSALSLDLYTWFSHRLCRVKESNGMLLSWEVLKLQFGQEYIHLAGFKRKFNIALKQVLAVYPDAKVEQHADGLLLKQSRPPIRKLSV